MYKHFGGYFMVTASRHHPVQTAQASTFPCDISFVTLYPMITASVFPLDWVVRGMAHYQKAIKDGDK